jgi:hypothetical protein
MEIRLQSNSRKNTLKVIVVVSDVAKPQKKTGKK